MKFLLSSLFLFVVCAVAACWCAPIDFVARRRDEKIDVESLLHALRDVESGDNPGAIGPCGERTAYQFTSATWCGYTVMPFERAGLCPALATTIARRHLDWLMKSSTWPLTVERLAEAWHRGLDGAREAETSDYAQRVRHLYDYYRGEKNGRELDAS
jgi:hypothetical protein